MFSDTANNRVRSLAFDDERTIATVLGTGRGGSGVGSGAETELCLPRGLCAFGQGFALADSANHRIVQFDLDWGPALSRKARESLTDSGPFTARTLGRW